MRHPALAIVAAVLFAMPAHGVEQKCELGQVGELPVTMTGTRPIISGTINGNPARFLVDSGAFWSVLSRESLAKLQLHEGDTPAVLIVGVGGEELAGKTKAKEFSLVGYGGGRIYNNVQFLVSSKVRIGDIDGVIGQNVIGNNDIEYDLANGAIRLFTSTGCSSRFLAYWHGNSSFAEMFLKRRTTNEPHWISDAKLNGEDIRVMFDTGASFSLLDRATAAKLGITPESDRATNAGLTSGIGPRAIELSVARFDTLDLGGELTKHARIQFGEIGKGLNVDLILGADFFLSHRIYFASK